MVGGLDGAARECGRADTGRWVLAVDAGPEGAAEVSAGCRREDHDRAASGGWISRNWEMRTLYKHGRERDVEQVCEAGG